MGKLSGAVGTYASVPPRVEARVMEALGLVSEDVSTQIVPRDRHAARGPGRFQVRLAAVEVRAMPPLVGRRQAPEPRIQGLHAIELG